MPVQLMDQSVAGAWLRDWRPKGNPRHTFVAHPSAAHCQMHSESLGTAPGVTALAALAAHTGEPTPGCHTQTQTPALHRTPAHPLWAEGNPAVSAPAPWEEPRECSIIKCPECLPSESTRELLRAGASPRQGQSPPCPSPSPLTPGPALDEFELCAGSSLVVLADLPAHAEAQCDHVVLLAVTGPAALGVIQQSRLQRPTLGTQSTLSTAFNHPFPKRDRCIPKPNSSHTPWG